MARTDPWFRFYTETTDDKKLKRAALECQVERCFVLAAWVALLAIAKKSPREGVLLIAKDTPATTYEIADEAGISSLEIVEKILKVFRRLDMISEINGAIVISHWGERQFKSDLSTDRVQQHRAKKGNVSETLPECSSNGPETESETDTETESEESREQTSAREPEKVPETVDLDGDQAGTEPEYVDLDEDQVEDDEFTRLQHALEQVIGLPIVPGDIPPIQEMIKLGVTRADIQGAAEWMAANGKTIRYAGQLYGPVRVQVAKRKQEGLGRGDPPGDGKTLARKQPKNGREDGLAAVREAIYGSNNDNDTET